MMKNTLTITLLMIGFLCFGQDQIIKKDGSELNVKITEISETILKYQKKVYQLHFQ